MRFVLFRVSHQCAFQHFSISCSAHNHEHQLQIKSSIWIPRSFLIGMWEERANEFTTDRIIREIRIIRSRAIKGETRHWISGRHICKNRVRRVMLNTGVGSILVRSLGVVVIQGEILKTGTPEVIRFLLRGGIFVLFQVRCFRER